jgi:outer membrane receptor protein involved in Fe transport
MRNLQCLLFAICIGICYATLSFAQTTTGITISGSVKNSKTQEGVPAASVTIKGTSSGTFTDDRGNFKLLTTQKPPFTLQISSVGFSDKEVSVTSDGGAVNILIDPSYALGQDIVVAASRLPERILESPVSIERVNSADIRNTAGASYYDALNNLKGVDIVTSSYTFKTVSTRGFNSSGNLRFNQLVDGMDNTAPALNFPVGNIIGLTELDVDNMELLEGASSALYGSGGMNGTLLISSKDPFKYQGVSVQVKGGVMHVNDPRHAASPLSDIAFRWGKKINDKLAFKITGEYIKLDDWRADDSTNLARNNVLSNVKPGTRASDPNYDGVNVYGDEASASMSAFSQAAIAQANLSPQAKYVLDQAIASGASYQQIQQGFASNPVTAPLNQILPFYMGTAKNVYGGQSVSRTGYYEKDLVDYNAYNGKISGGLYYKINDNTEASLTANWGMGTSVYTGADRYSLKNFTMGQYQALVKSKNWLLRAYTTQENSGDSYASTLAALSINNAWKPNSTWFGQYTGTYSGYILSGATPDQANAAARATADAGRYLPGTPDYQNAFNTAVKTRITGNGGAQFADKSSLYQFEGQLNLSQYVKVVDVLVGASYRWYNINSKGTIFADTAGPIKIAEYGTYIQLQKRLFNDVLKLSASGRYDKNQNFDGRFTPRVTATVKVAKDNNFRFSYQQAYRFPTNQDQWINLQTPGSILIGCLPGFNTYYNFSGNPVYTAESVVAYRASVDGGAPNPALLQKAAFTAAKPETMQSFEVGYRGIIAKNFLVDAYYYFSKYQDFLGRTAVARGSSGNPENAPVDLASPFTTTNFSFVQNSPTPVKATGWGISAQYHLRKGYSISGNVYSDMLNNVPAGLVTFFNTPKYRYNIGFSNTNVYKNIGFNIAYKWQDKVYWEGTFGTGTIPSFATLDAQISYKMPKEKILFKLGGTNISNHYYRNAFGNPYIGGLYYLSVGYNVF